MTWLQKLFTKKKNKEEPIRKPQPYVAPMYYEYDRGLRKQPTYLPTTDERHNWKPSVNDDIIIYTPITDQSYDGGAGIQPHSFSSTNDNYHDYGGGSFGGGGSSGSWGDSDSSSSYDSGGSSDSGSSDSGSGGGD